MVYRLGVQVRWVNWSGQFWDDLFDLGLGKQHYVCESRIFIDVGEVIFAVRNIYFGLASTINK